MELPMLVVDFVKSQPEPSEGNIVRVPPEVYYVLTKDMDFEVMEGIDFYAYSAMITYCHAKYLSFGSICYDYTLELLRNYNNALTSATKCITHYMVNTENYNVPLMDKFMKILYYNWITVNKVFMSTILPFVHEADPKLIIDMLHIEDTFRYKYPVLD